MLNPEVELRALVVDLADPTDVSLGDHISLRKARSMVAHAMEATQELSKIIYGPDSTTQEALSALDRLQQHLTTLKQTSPPYRSKGPGI